MKLTFRVVAVPERLARAQQLASDLDGWVILDETRAGTLHTHMRALTDTVDSGATHAVILEDDAILCPDFLTHVQTVVAERPTHLIGLYVGRQKPMVPQEAIAELVQDRPAWLDHPRITDKLRWGVGYVMPVADIPDALAAIPADTHPWLDADKKIGTWHAARGLVSYPFPSPVEHDDGVRSTTSRHGRGRVAWEHCTGGER